MAIPKPISEQDLELARLRRRLLVALGLLTLVTSIGVVGFFIIGGGAHGFVDAAYMTIISLTTVGYGEVVDMTGNPGARVFTMVLLLSGMGIVAYTVPALAGFVIEGQLNHVFARRKMQKDIDKMRGHFVICGDTPQSFHVAQELAQTGRSLVFVAPGDEALAAMRHEGLDVPAFVGDPCSDESLHGAGIERASGVIFAIESEKDNVIGTLTARRLAPQARIVATARTPETEAKLVAVGADAVVRPQFIGGLRLASVLVRPAVVTFLDTMLRQGGALRVEEATVPEDAAERKLGSLGLDDIPGALVLALRPKDARDFLFKPAPETPVSPGAVVVVMADPQGLERVRERLSRAG